MSRQRPEPSVDALADLLAQHGAHPERWPDDARESALELTRRDDAARALLRDAVALDDALDSWQIAEAPLDLASRIAAATPERTVAGDVLALPLVRLWQGALLAALPVLVGFVLAVNQPAPRAADEVRAGTPAAHAELAHLSAFGLIAGAPGPVPQP